MSAQELRSDLAREAPALWADISTIAQKCVSTIIDNLARKSSHERFPKTVNDPVWGTIELFPWEVAILDSPLVQRLRGISQLGLASYVYPGASHSRLEHILGVIETAQRMMNALERNADNHRHFGKDKDPAVPAISLLDRHSIRLGALLHDIGHGPYSHVTEMLLYKCFPEEFAKAEKVLRHHFRDVTKIAPSETIAVLLVLSEEMGRVFEHPHFEAVSEAHRLPAAIACRILGSRSNLYAGYLSGVISGPIDADKIDYMARDSYHSGFPVGLDFNRLISKLEVIIITPENAPNAELQERAQTAGGRSYEMGISLSGLGAYEQMIMGRALLYDRLYYHHKVRAAEHMLQRLIGVATEETGRRLTLSGYFALFSETEYLSVWSGFVRSPEIDSGGARSKRIGGALLTRQVYNRAACIAARFLGGLDGLPRGEREDTRQLQWDGLVTILRSDKGADDFAAEIFALARQLGGAIPELSAVATNLTLEEILVDFPINKAKLGRGNDLLTRTEAGRVVPPNLFFDAEKWSLAYEHQKLVGHVFAPLSSVPLVALASRIALFMRFGVVMGADADNAAKTTGVVSADWIRKAAEAALCSAECAEALTTEKPVLLQMRSNDLRIPADWSVDDPDIARRLAEGFRDAIPGGLPAGARKGVIDTLFDLMTFVEMIEKSGEFTARTELAEKTLQQELKKHLRSREVPVTEGSEIGGGETDLVVYDKVLIENKSRDLTTDPFESGLDYPFQARRYSIALLRRVSFVVLSYRPSTETSLLPLTARIRVSRINGVPEDHAEVRVVVPWGTGVPSKAKAPR